MLRKYPASAIVPLTPNGDVVLIRQFRIPVRQELLEVPAGLLDVPGEDALTCAERELYEETGYRSHDTSFLGGLYLSPGTTDDYVHLFVGHTAVTAFGETRQRQRGLAGLQRPAP